MNIPKSHDLAPFHSMNAISLPLVDPTQNCYIKNLSLQIPTSGIYICSLHGWAPTALIEISLSINYLLVFFFFLGLMRFGIFFWIYWFAIVYYIAYIASITCTTNTPGLVLFSSIICSLVTFCVILNVIIFSFLFLFDNLVYYFKFIGCGLILQFLLNKSERL